MATTLDAFIKLCVMTGRGVSTKKEFTYKAVSCALNDPTRIPSCTRPFQAIYLKMISFVVVCYVVLISVNKEPIIARD